MQCAVLMMVISSVFPWLHVWFRASCAAHDNPVFFSRVLLQTFICEPKGILQQPDEKFFQLPGRILGAAESEFEA